MIHFTNARLINPETLTDSLGSLTINGPLIHTLNTPAPNVRPSGRRRAGRGVRRICRR